MENPDLVRIFYAFLTFAGLGLLLALVLLGWVIWRVRRIRVPPGADFFETLLYTPLTVVLLLDLLDFSLDFLSAPLAWALLDRLGLKALRGVTVVESIIPGTQILPTMTVAWIAARFLRPR